MKTRLNQNHSFDVEIARQSYLACMEEMISLQLSLKKWLICVANFHNDLVLLTYKLSDCYLEYFYISVLMVQLSLCGIDSCSRQVQVLLYIQKEIRNAFLIHLLIQVKAPAYGS